MEAGLINATAHGVHIGTVNFPDAVARLISAGVEYYHVDYVGLYNCYYSATDEVVRTEIPFEGLEPVASEWDGEALKQAILDSQLNKQSFRDFTVRARQAGVQGYYAFLAGRQVVYFGRKGEMHIEPFPNHS